MDKHITEINTEMNRDAQSLDSSKKSQRQHNQCEACGSNLHFRHQTDFSRNLTQEITQCPECGAAPKSILHRLQ